MAGTNLYELVQSASNSNATVRIGYTVNDTYNGVLAHLGLNLLQDGSYGVIELLSTSEMLFGSSGIYFDNNGFSYDLGHALWKMELSLFGALIIQDPNYSRYQIVPVEGNTPENIWTPNDKQIPYSFDYEPEKVKSGTMKFESGVFVDVKETLPKYLNQMYTNPTTNDKFDVSKTHALITHKLLRALIMIVENGVTSSLATVTVIGTTSGGNPNQILINPAFAISKQGQALKIPLIIDNFDNNGTKSSIDVVTNSTIDCPIRDKKYNVKDASIDGLGADEYNKWKEGRHTEGQIMQTISIKLINSKQCVVKFFIPDELKSQATQVLGFTPLEQFFTSYKSATPVKLATAGAVGFNMDRAIKSIVASMQKAGRTIWNSKHIKNSKGYPSENTYMHQKKSSISATSSSVSMAGWLIIPAGWPMCNISQGFGGRSASTQALKGLEGQSSTGKVLSWVRVNDPSRLDNLLSINDNLLSIASKDKAWIDERINKANKGPIKIAISSALQPGSKFSIALLYTQFFALTFGYYLEAADLYNNGIPAPFDGHLEYGGPVPVVEEQTSATELLLRCAPTLCSISGNSPVHRIRSSFDTGHYAGRAIDFCHSLNDDVGSFADLMNKTHIGKGMSTGYAPMLYALISTGGFWGGSYRFMKNGNFDAMHIQY